MRENRHRGIGIAATAFAVGATAGSLIALLFAPVPGKVTRKRLAMRLRTAQRSAADRMEEGLTQAREWLVERVADGNGRHHPRHRVARHA